MKNFILMLALLVTCYFAGAQPWVKNLPAGKTRENLTFYDYQKAFNDYWAPFQVEKGFYTQNGERIKAPGWKQFKRWEYRMERMINPSDGKFPAKDAASIVNEYLSDHPAMPMTAWSSLGPSSSTGGYAGVGRLNCIAFHPSDLNTWWVGAASGGLWKTSDNGASWSCLTDFNPVLAVSDIIIPPDYSTSQTIYIATGDKDHWDNQSVGVLKSTDGGASWTPTGISYTPGMWKMVNRLLADPNNNQVLIAATTNGVYKTTNGGTAWSIQLTSTDFIDMEYKPGDFNTIYGCTTNGKIYRTTNGGTSWSEVYSDASAYRMELAVSANQPAWVYALAVNNYSGLYGVFRSTNSGESFSQVFSGTTSNMLGWNSDGSGTGGQGWYDLCLAVAPGNASIVLLGGVNTWRSTNGGTSWSIVNHWWGDGVPAVHADKHWLVFRSNGYLYEANDGGIYLSQDNGTTWTDKTNGMVISQMYKLGVSATVANEVITGLQDNGTKLLTGGAWDDVKGGDGMECLIDYTNVNIQYGTYVNGQISRTMDHWNSATDIEPSGAGDGAWVTPYIIDPFNPLVLYAGYADVWKTTDRGSNWTQISSMSTGDLIRSMAIAPSNAQVLYVADPNQLWKTTNGGASWTEITGTLPVGSGSITYICVKHNDPNTLWVTLGGFNATTVFQSTNAGSSWTNISAGLPQIPAYSIVQNKQSSSTVHLYVGTEAGVWFKKGTDNWSLYSTGLPNVVIGELEIYYNNANPQNSKLRAATYGRGLWEVPVYYSPVAMTYNLTRTTQNNTSTVGPDMTNQQIICVEVQTSGDLNPLSATSFTFNTSGSTNPATDISNARLFYTGYSNVFATGTQFGTVAANPSGTFTITGTQLLYGGTNFFWLTYDISATATIDNYVDAQCTSLTVGSVRTPEITNPAGNRRIAIVYCNANGNHCDEYIQRVTAGSIDNVSPCTPGGYTDYSTMYTNLLPGGSLPVTVTNGNPVYGEDFCGIWVDWNNNGNFLDDAAVTVAGSPGSGPYTATITCPPGTTPGPKRLRIRIHYNDEPTSPCGASYWGEVEDYTIMINAVNLNLAGTLSNGQVKCYSALETITVAGSGTSFIVPAGASATLVAGQKIRFLPGAYAASGGYMHGYISASNPYCTPLPLPGAPVISADAEEMPVSTRCRIWPNPTSGHFNLEIPENFDGEGSVEIFGLHGEKVLTLSLSNQRTSTLSLNGRPAGIYFMRITTGKQTTTHRLVKL